MREAYPIYKNRDLTVAYDREDFLIIRISNRLICGKDQVGIPTQSWVTLIDPKTGSKVCRRAKGVSDQHQFLQETEIEIDKGAVLGDLQQSKGAPDLKGFYKCDLLLRKATFLEKVNAIWSYPDTSMRIPLQISLISLVLGVLGFTIGLAGIILSIIK
jgi:hypothetical protein